MFPDWLLWPLGFADLSDAYLKSQERATQGHREETTLTALIPTHANEAFATITNYTSQVISFGDETNQDEPSRDLLYYSAEF